MSKLSLFPAIFLVACSSSYLEAPEGRDDAAARWLLDGTAEAYGVLELLNDPIITLELLDSAVALDARAARGLAHHRNGPDGEYGTPDDNPFETIDEVDGVYWVGDSALDRLVSFADAHGYIPAGDDEIGQFDDVWFTLDEAILTVDMINASTPEFLDDDLGLHSIAAGNLIELGPFDTIAEIAEVPYVGTSALLTLRDAAVW